jgi:hypothetical protein
MISEIIIILSVLFLFLLILAPIIYYWNKRKDE